MPQPSEASASSEIIDPRALMRQLKPFTTPSTGRSLWELAVTLALFFSTTAVTLILVDRGYWIALALNGLSGLSLLRLFVIQHDCGHGAFLKNKRASDWIGRALGVLTFTPYDGWRYSHARHHATTGNLDARGLGDVDTLTVREYAEASAMDRLRYRLYRHPAVLFGLGPAYLFLLRHRFPIGLMDKGWTYWASVLASNLALALIVAPLIWQFGWLATLSVVLPTVLIAGGIGVWLFYVQHQYEAAHWETADTWKFYNAALHGSSYLDLPQPLRWFTANIGIHHVHHLASTIPFYRLPEVLEAYPALKDMNRMTARETIRPMTLALWDEERGKLVSFREAAATA
ncbi:MAG: fatty acid desaturase [Pseudomonadota bacterium]